MRVVAAADRGKAGRTTLAVPAPAGHGAMSADIMTAAYEWP